MKQIIKAVLKAQKEMGDATKGAKNPFFKSQYADLNAIREACMPLLNENGIIVLQPTVHIDGKNFVKTILMHESGETIEGLTEILFAKTNDAQAQGSGITYARRYGLQSLVNIGAKDDDGNKASEKPLQVPPPIKKAPPAPQKVAKIEITQGDAEKLLTGAKDVKELGAVWNSLTTEMQAKVLQLKNQLKSQLK